MEVNVKILLNHVEKNLGYFKFKRERERKYKLWNYYSLDRWIEKYDILSKIG